MTRDEVPQTLRNLSAAIQHVAGQMQQFPDLDTYHQSHTFCLFQTAIETRAWAGDIERLERDRLRDKVDEGRQS
jgi:hypothetical protein